jgi:hypothetical protein
VNCSCETRKTRHFVLACVRLKCSNPQQPIGRRHYLSFWAQEQTPCVDNGGHRDQRQPLLATWLPLPQKQIR